MDEKIKIYVCCHKPSYVPGSRLFIPVQAGAALAESVFPGMRGDDSGENISEKNPQYCELTPQYWAWKNENFDFAGFFHYRRYLSFDRVYPVAPDGRRRISAHACPFTEIEDIRAAEGRNGLAEARMREIIPQYDLITVMRERINTSVYRQYIRFHDREPLDRVLRILGRLFPEYIPAAKEYLASRDIYYMNMYVMRREMLQRYMQWLFSVLEEYESGLRRKRARGACTSAAAEPALEQGAFAEPRLMGYLAERLFGIFFVHQRRNGAKCAEVPYLRFYRTAPDGVPEEEPSSTREFHLKPFPWKIKIDMRRLARLAPAGSRRRNLLRSAALL
ncbi:MAG: DUF4422 domain-containing protein [Stomatobaculum sp.]